MKNPTVLLLCLVLAGVGVFLAIRPGGSDAPPAPEMTSHYHAHGPSHSHGPGGHHHTGGHTSLADLQERLSDNPNDVALRSQVIHQAISEDKPEIAIEQCYEILEHDPENEYARVLDAPIRLKNMLQNAT